MSSDRTPLVTGTRRRSERFGNRPITRLGTPHADASWSKPAVDGAAFATTIARMFRPATRASCRNVLTALVLVAPLFAESVTPHVPLATVEPVPAQPAEKDWHFIQELQQPYHMTKRWKPRSPHVDEADLSRGITIETRFPDPMERLDTAYGDLNDFLNSVGVRRPGPFRIVTEQCPMEVPETYRVVVSADECRIQAGDTEGIRRGIFFVEDRLLSARGPFLPRGAVTRSPVIRTRISRCFFGPIKRPPKNRDELLDDVNYYPDPYLNRLAHEGVNGLWLTIAFADFCKNEAFPGCGRDADKRLTKLRDTVRRCLRYGIKTYVFCIEPAAFPVDSPVLAAHPDLGGHKAQGCVYFCASSKAGQDYVQEVTRNLFAAVPDLGGLINICVGERPTLCPNAGVENNNCPRCSKRQPWEVLADCLAAMARGMHAANPSAELISWFYLPNNWTDGKGWGEAGYREAAEHIPDGVILQHNFESNGGKEQLGKWRLAGDYWLSYIGPSPRFIDCAGRAAAHGTRMFAKLQVGCSHEVANVPFVPVPGNLYQKYKAMHELGVSGAMQCWYFGNYPGVMNRAAGELAFAPFPASEDDFLLELARRDWGPDAPTVVRTFKLFSKGYDHYPLNCLFSYYGPMANGVVWPLYLIPRDLPLEPTWKLEYPPSGDRIGECIASSHTLDEVLILCGQMARLWNEGVDVLRALRPRYTHDANRLKDIGLAEALGIQFRSGSNILRFYALREKLARAKGTERLEILEQMKTRVNAELALDEQLLPLAQADSRLGFHSEAEGYKYFPEKIRWRMRQLRSLLATEFPAVERRVRAGLVAFPQYTGEEPLGKVADCPRIEGSLPLDGRCFEGVWATLPTNPLVGVKTSPDSPARNTVWRAVYDSQALHIGLICRNSATATSPAVAVTTQAAWNNESVEILLEPRRLWPVERFRIAANGRREHTIIGGQPNQDWQAAVCRGQDLWAVQVRIPFECLGLNPSELRPIRLNVIHQCTVPSASGWWVPRHPIQARLLYGAENPADLGWLRFAGPGPATAGAR